MTTPAAAMQRSTSIEMRVRNSDGAPSAPTIRCKKDSRRAKSARRHQVPGKGGCIRVATALRRFQRKPQHSDLTSAHRPPIPCRTHRRCSHANHREMSRRKELGRAYRPERRNQSPEAMRGRTNLQPDEASIRCLHPYEHSNYWGAVARSRTRRLKRLLCEIEHIRAGSRRFA